MPRPVEIKLHQKSRVLELAFDDDYSCHLSCEYLRVMSPSAEVKGHGPGQEVLQTHKEEVGISEIEPAGNYAIKIKFDDGHDTGLYTWDYLHGLGKNYEANWQAYLDKLSEAGITRQPSTQRG